MAYEYFYEYYDELMSDIPYQSYIQLVSQYIKKEDRILDIGCGTGTVLIELLKKGYTVEGLDISDEMLLMTQKKLTENKLISNLYHDDMRHIQISDAYNVIYSYLDTINYLITIEDVKETFEKIHDALKKDGYFIFDVHSFHTVDEIFDGYSYNETRDDFVYIWNVFVEQMKNSKHVYHELNFFIKAYKDHYERKEEFHKQVVFTTDFYLDLLKEVGFTIEKILYDFDSQKNEKNSNKVIFVVKKCLT